MTQETCRQSPISCRKELEILKENLREERVFCEICGKQDDVLCCKAFRPGRDIYDPRNYIVLCRQCNYRMRLAEQDEAKRINELIERTKKTLSEPLKNFVDEFYTIAAATIISLVGNNHVKQRPTIDSYFGGAILYERQPYLKKIIDACDVLGVPVDINELQRRIKAALQKKITAPPETLL